MVLPSGAHLYTAVLVSECVAWLIVSSNPPLLMPFISIA